MHKSSKRPHVAGRLRTSARAGRLNSLSGTPVGIRLLQAGGQPLHELERLGVGGHPLDRAAVEMAFFGAGGAIDRIVTLDFRALAEGKTKVLQFQLARLDCAAVSRVLVNDITACEGEGLAPTACLAGLAPSARPDIAFGI